MEGGGGGGGNDEDEEEKRRGEAAAAKAKAMEQADGGSRPEKREKRQVWQLGIDRGGGREHEKKTVRRTTPSLARTIETVGPGDLCVAGDAAAAAVCFENVQSPHGQ